MNEQITKEWEWVPVNEPFSTPHHYIFEWLMWRGMVLASLEAFTSDRFFGNIGAGFPPLDFENRVAHVKRPEDAKRYIEANVLQLLNAIL